MSSLGLRISALVVSLLGVAPAAAASIAVTTSESDSDTFPETTGEAPQLITIVEPATNDVFVGAPEAKVQVIIEFDPTFDGADIHLVSKTRLDGDGPWTEVKDDVCAAGPSPCMLDLSLAPDKYMLSAQGEGPGGALEQSVVIIEVVEGEATDTDASGSATEGETGETGSAPTSSATGDGPGTDSTGSTTGDDPSASGGDPADGDKGCACSTGASGPDVLGLALALLLVPGLRRRR
ncbi:MYXO-CTERM sorting domain-containing protein [Nannocystis sp. RBIL2]|uniref:MYXO-CTERM sorting domain-containing protein n=1 Tax=Nannocystis sp. RBIL2 TaxID=2996788 RepID=UPI00227158E3|nr:MYXO-CTERM sorting domain-containing protein [Nannocystis sp. RBIL2]MCY1064630.1 MYXO-CTERM sorting domain-containing protein [Nannocystis sp. RBIL2]